MSHIITASERELIIRTLRETADNIENGTAYNTEMKLDVSQRVESRHSCDDRVLSYFLVDVEQTRELTVRYKVNR